MSTNKTTNYQLHSWEPRDDFLRSEFNENFTAIDGAIKAAVVLAGTEKVKMVAGEYEGTGGTRTIELGFRPKAVLVTTVALGNYYHALIVDGGGDSDGQIVANGFQVGSYLNGTMSGYTPCSYLALWWAD